MRRPEQIEPTALAVFVRRRLEELEITQSAFSRLSGFDQGLLSRVLNSMTTNLGLQNALRLAVGLHVPPKQIFMLIDRTDLHDLMLQSYASEREPEPGHRRLEPWVQELQLKAGQD